MRMKKVIFICTGNACRSQMAEGFLNYYKGNKFEVYSAGTNPTKVHPAAIKVMSELKIDISNHTSDHMNDFLDKGIDIVITVCDDANQKCPVFPGSQKSIHWSIKDPFINWSDEHHLLEPYRKTRNIILEKIKEFID